MFFQSEISGSHPTKSFPNFPSLTTLVFTEEGNSLISLVKSKVYSIDKGQVFTTNQLGEVTLVE